MSELDQYDYELPRELIAQYPRPQRADARMLVVDRRTGLLESAHVRDLPQWLRPGDALVLNDTRVMPASLLGYRVRTGGRWTGLFLSADAGGMWRVLGRTRGKLQAGESIMLQDLAGRDALPLHLLAPWEHGIWTARAETEESAWEALERVGRTPLPPYIRGGEMQPGDREAYQTVYAAHPGAVAAPTAGLHFTEPLLERLQRSGVVLCRVTLHVGPGTFRPIAEARLSDHEMHAEWGSLSDSTAARILQLRAQGGRIAAVGTTSVRVLETAAAGGRLRGWTGETKLFIRPPHRFAAVDLLLTNFHLPKSTLLVLVCAFAGRELIEKAYGCAIREGYRFYSYGDAMLIL